LLGLVPSVQCVAGVLNYAAERIRRELLPRFPNVDGVVALNHSYGCGVAIDSPNAEIPIRTLRNLALHPNFGGEALVVGLGCEKLAAERIAPQRDAQDNEVSIVRLQEEAGFAAMVEKIMKLAEGRLARLDARRRVPCSLSDLVVGVQCGGSDAFSGVTANPAIGYASDLLVQAGATVMFSEVTEVRDAVHLLLPRSATREVRRDIIREMKWYDAYLARGGADRSANTAPGNKKGGLANIVEKSLGSIIKSGTSPISSVLGPGERSSVKGLVFVATPASDFICGTLQLASGIHLQVFSTGRGTPYGLAMAPVIKVATREALAKQWPDLIDIDAGRIATGAASVEDVGLEILSLIVDVASGRTSTWAEKHGLENDLVLFNPAPVT
jgi:galactarate dehydratase